MRVNNSVSTHLSTGHTSTDTAEKLPGSPDRAAESSKSDQCDDGNRKSGGLLGIHHHHLNHLRSRKSRRKSSVVPGRTPTPSSGKRFWKFHLREWDDDDEQDWWFASTAIPLLAATIGPLAGVLSIAALVTSWRMCLIDNIAPSQAAQCAWDGDPTQLGPQLDGQDFADPRWCYLLNIVSLVVGFVGNFFLLCNFTNRIRYIIALPVTILCWYIATGILIGITVSMDIWQGPVRPQQTYTQGFWYAIIAACMYMICAMLLMVNMLGYFLGHYPQHFTLTESQRTLILQTMLFFVWLAGGAAVFSRVETLYGDGDYDWSYANSLYFCDVTILTVGFGDIVTTSSAGRGLIFPYSVGGIIMLGLMVSSITKFAAELGSEKIIQRHFERSRAKAISRTVTSSSQLDNAKPLQEGERPVISAPFNPIDRSEVRAVDFAVADGESTGHHLPKPLRSFQKVGSILKTPHLGPNKSRLILLKEEKDRFNEMRRIQHHTNRFKTWYALFLSVSAFGVLWCVGAVVFWQCEKDTQGMTYFEGLYFCYVSLLTIGYGDFAPQSNAGRPFFVFWSLIAIPTMTILVSDLGETVVNKFKSATSRLSDFTVLPQKGAYREFLNRYPALVGWLQRRKEDKEQERRLEAGFPTGPAEDEEQPPTIDQLAGDEPSEHELAQKLTRFFRRAVTDVKQSPERVYSYEEWVEITQLIRFTAQSRDEVEQEEEEEGLIEWDWIGEDSPMMAHKTEPEFVLDRLCESMQRYVRKMEKWRRRVENDGQEDGEGAKDGEDDERRIPRRHGDEDGPDEDGSEDRDVQGASRDV